MGDQEWRGVVGDSPINLHADDSLGPPLIDHLIPGPNIPQPLSSHQPKVRPTVPPDDDAAGDFVAPRFEVELERVAGVKGDVAGGVGVEVHGATVGQ